MKILLINPHYYLVKKITSFERFFTPIPILGLAYLASVLKNNGNDVHIIDDYVDRFGVNGIIKYIEQDNPDIIGISCLTPYADDTYYLSKKIKEKFPDKFIIMGNKHADYYANEIVSERIADIVIHGEGENTIVDIVNAVRSKNSFSVVKNITYSDGLKPIRNLEKNTVDNLDTIPYPAWELLKLDAYFPGATVSTGGHKHLPLLMSRGCPYSCIYCSQEFGNTVRIRSIQNVIGEIITFYEKFNVDSFVICDANFPLNKKYALDFCNTMINEGLSKKIKWATETRPDLLDEELVCNMKKAGCTKILMGFESGSDRILNVLNKKFSTEDSKSAVKLLNKFSVSVNGLFVIGNPTETKDEIKKTINFSKKLGIDYAKFNLFVPYPGTPAFENLEIRSRINAKNFRYFYSYPDNYDLVVYTPEGIDKEELLRLQRYAFLRFYFRPSMIIKQIIKLRYMKIKEYFDGFIYLIQTIFKI
ncbi:MAG: hypothetical protein ACD_79C00311G0005 [uncultured bacterium]|nr:MAG: hypothetical protein ACD_79C00311G0005 [uncultured bacterium]